MTKGSKTTLRGRDAKDGQFTTVKHAREHPKTHVVEHTPKSGRGDTDRGISQSSRAIFHSTSETYGNALKRLAKK